MEKGKLPIQFYVDVEVKERAERIVKDHKADSYREIFEVGLKELEEKEGA